MTRRPWGGVEPVWLAGASDVHVDEVSGGGVHVGMAGSPVVRPFARSMIQEANRRRAAAMDAAIASQVAGLFCCSQPMRSAIPATPTRPREALYKEITP